MIETRDIFENAKVFDRPKGIMSEYVDMSAFQNQKEQFSTRWGVRNNTWVYRLKAYANKRWVPSEQVEGLL